jgi:nickel transport protein
MIRVFLVLLSVLIAGPATAHSLRLFAKVDGAAVSGYAFFIGGGRPVGVTWVAKMGTQTVATGKTGQNGDYSFTVPDQVAEGISITVDTGEGHIATTLLKPDRFSIVGAATASPQVEATAADEAATVAVSPLSGDATAKLVEEAVERQVGPLLERIEAMDARMRFTDIMSGIFLILGLAGMALWARGRKL